MTDNAVDFREAFAFSIGLKGENGAFNGVVIKTCYNHKILEAGILQRCL